LGTLSFLVTPPGSGVSLPRRGASQDDVDSTVDEGNVKRQLPLDGARERPHDVSAADAGGDETRDGGDADERVPRRPDEGENGDSPPDDDGERAGVGGRRGSWRAGRRT
jgi:hypothetical protein